MWNLRQWRHIFSDESGSPYTTVTAESGCAIGKGRLIDACIQPNDRSRGPSAIIWHATHHGRRAELVVVEN